MEGEGREGWRWGESVEGVCKRERQRIRDCRMAKRGRVMYDNQNGTDEDG